MNTKKEMGNIIGIIILCAIILFSFVYLFCLGHSFMQEQRAYINTLEATTFDTSALEDWCKGETNKVRMVGAHEHIRNDDTIVLEDDQGNLWGVDSVNITPDDFLLLWLDDNGTPGDVSDDYVVKIWTEAHG